MIGEEGQQNDGAVTRREERGGTTPSLGVIAAPSKRTEVKSLEPNDVRNRICAPQSVGGTILLKGRKKRRQGGE